jgi:hypothetical protein
VIWRPSPLTFSIAGVLGIGAFTTIVNLTSAEPMVDRLLTFLIVFSSVITVTFVLILAMTLPADRAVEALVTDPKNTLVFVAQVSAELNLGLRMLGEQSDSDPRAGTYVVISVRESELDVWKDAETRLASIAASAVTRVAASDAVSIRSTIPIAVHVDTGSARAVLTFTPCRDAPWSAFALMDPARARGIIGAIQGIVRS